MRCCSSSRRARRDFEAFEGYTARLQGLVTRESTPIWQKRWTYAYGAEILATNENRTGTGNAVVSLSDAYFIGGLIGQLGHDRSNSLLDPTRGFRLLARVNPEASFGNGSDVYIRNLIEGSVYYPVGEDFVIAGRARFGSIFGIARDDLAPSRRFYAGGGGSVRGFGYQELGPREILPNPDFDPQDPDDTPPTIAVPLGGRSLVEFALEGRYRFGNYGVVAFVDAGQVYEAQYPTFSSMRFGVGVGGRVYTNFGPVRVDVATPIGRRQGESLDQHLRLDRAGLLMAEEAVIVRRRHPGVTVAKWAGIVLLGLVALARRLPALAEHRSGPALHRQPDQRLRNRLGPPGPGRADRGLGVRRADAARPLARRSQGHLLPRADRRARLSPVRLSLRQRHRHPLARHSAGAAEPPARASRRAIRTRRCSPT